MIRWLTFFFVIAILVRLGGCGDYIPKEKLDTIERKIDGNNDLLRKLKEVK